MSLPVPPEAPIPEETVRVAHAAFPKRVFKKVAIHDDEGLPSAAWNPEHRTRLTSLTRSGR